MANEPSLTTISQIIPAIQCPDCKTYQRRLVVQSGLFSAQRERMMKEAVFWQGKFQMVCHENNQLRKKLKPKA